VVCLSVCHDSEPCRTAEPIKMPFGLWTRVGPRAQGTMYWIDTIWRMNRPCAAAMRPYVKLLWPLVPFI